VGVDEAQEEGNGAVNWYVLWAVLVMAGVTFALRLLPFAALGRVADTPPLRYVSAMMPPGIMVMLVAYNLRTVDVTSSAHGVPMIAAVATTVLTYHWRRNALISIVSGTAVHIALLHLLR
jgi:branched-subunit amino acid transport protein AzlD